jgi:putative tryptophan/tyrosine transport system substrate-binding protein
MQFGQLQRRVFISLLGGAAVWPLAARAQQPAMPVIGFLHSGFPSAYTDLLTAMRQGLKESGYVEGGNLAIEYRWANDAIDRLPELAAQLVHRKVEAMIVSGGFPPTVAAKAATSTIPIVMMYGGNPVRTGLIASLNRPGGNVTGVTFLTTELVPKRLDLLRELVPQVVRLGYLADPRSEEGRGMARDITAAAATLGRELAVEEARSVDDLEPAYARLVSRGVGALVGGTEPLVHQQPR